MQINVTDVNDNAPHLVIPHTASVRENSVPQVVARVTLDDPDDWQLGHGPPFTMRLDPHAPVYISRAVHVTFDPGKCASRRGASDSVTDSFRVL